MTRNSSRCCWISRSDLLEKKSVKFTDGNFGESLKLECQTVSDAKSAAAAVDSPTGVSVELIKDILK